VGIFTTRSKETKEQRILETYFISQEDKYIPHYSQRWIKKEAQGKIWILMNNADIVRNKTITKTIKITN